MRTQKNIYGIYITSEKNGTALVSRRGNRRAVTYENQNITRKRGYH